jgi:predicted enzyme related to lactoylglutathione lyase
MSVGIVPAPPGLDSQGTVDDAEEAPVSGRVIHFEIPADDLDRAQAFYREMFGWRVNAIPGLNYALVGTTPADEQGMPTDPGAINGGMLQRQDPVRAPVVVVEVDDIDAALPAIEKLGGAVARAKFAVGDMGFAAYFTDPEGNVVGLWQNAG